jgi:AraC family transcriptional regulator
VDQFLAALEAVYPGKTGQVDVVDFFGRDEALAHMSLVCAEMLSTGAPGKSTRVTVLTQLLAAHLVEKYTDAASEKADFRGGLPIRLLRNMDDYVRERLAEDIPVEALADLVELSPFHFSRVFKQATGLSQRPWIVPILDTRKLERLKENLGAVDVELTAIEKGSGALYQSFLAARSPSLMASCSLIYLPSLVFPYHRDPGI